MSATLGPLNSNNRKILKSNMALFNSPPRNQLSLNFALVGILITCLLFPVNSSAESLKEYISKNYLVKHDLYDNLPENQYKAVGRATKNDYLAKHDKWPVITHEYIAFTDGLFLFNLLAQMKFTLEKFNQPETKEIQMLKEAKRKSADDDFISVSNDIFLNMKIKTEKDTFLFYFYNKIDKNSSEFVVQDKSAMRNFFYGFAIIRNNKVYTPADSIKIANPKTGVYSKSLWDVFTYKGNEYILVLNRAYDNLSYEVYEINGDKLKFVLNFDFGS